jgi:hypothetical protein
VGLRETLRRDPVVGGVVRVATEDLALGGYHVPAGSTLLVPLRHLAETDPRWAGDTGKAAARSSSGISPVCVSQLCCHMGFTTCSLLAGREVRTFSKC